ncbi:MAG: hypothetical protein R3B57_01865 [Phycisphaerales bacterium]
MRRCQLEENLTRVEMEGMRFPLGVYPVEALTPVQGYLLEFEPADGDDEEGEWEEWPDRYVFDIVITADRVEALCRQLFALLPGRVYPILDYMGHDAYREIDPYMGYELIGQDRFMDAVRRYRDFFFEDGMVGFGAQCDDPFAYVFVDEHKIVTVRVPPELKESVEHVLRAFDLEEVPEPRGADSAAHEHRGVLLAPNDQPELMSGEEIVERLRDEWRLVLNVDAERNVNDEGDELGVTDWRCLVRCATERDPRDRYLEILLRAEALGEAEDLATETASSRIDRQTAGSWVDLVVVAADRMAPEQTKEALGEAASGGGGDSDTGDGILSVRWL